MCQPSICMRSLTKTAFVQIMFSQNVFMIKKKKLQRFEGNIPGHKFKRSLIASYIVLFHIPDLEGLCW